MECMTMPGASIASHPNLLLLSLDSRRRRRRSLTLGASSREEPEDDSKRRNRSRRPLNHGAHTARPLFLVSCPSLLLICSVILTCLFRPTAAFFAPLQQQTPFLSAPSILSSFSRRSQEVDTQLQYAPSKYAEVITQPLEPLRHSPEERRQRAVSAMQQQQQQQLQLQVSSERPRRPSRPKGRPESVPGAMAQETMARYQQQQQQPPPPPIWEEWSAPYSAASTSRRAGKDAPVHRPSKGEVVRKIAPRKKVFKNLPKSSSSSRDRSDDAAVDRTLLKVGSKGPSNGMDINQYYRTELLTSDEEYSLGMKIQFMDRCEQVHEGLAAARNALPTIQEWAAACGFTDPDPHFVATEADEQLRPIGSDLMFEDLDPNLFVGNGLAHQTGPGRGRGRAKRPPPLALADFYEDDVSSQNHRPINRGTPTDFVERLMTAHEAKQRMVQSNMRLVVSIARKYANAGVNLQDLVQEGSLGLSRAAEKFEPKKGFKFSTYASWWIQQAVFRSIAYHSRTIRLPVHVHNLLNRVRKVRQALQSELGRAPTNEEIAEQLGMSRQKYNKMLHLTKRSISLEAPKYRSNPKDLGHESDDLLGDTISKSTVLEDEATPQKSVDHGLFHEDLRDMMQILDPDEHRVICARYGLQDGLTRTVTVVAAQMKQSKAWVRSQECRALRKLRRPWYEKKLKEHQDALAC